MQRFMSIEPQQHVAPLTLQVESEPVAIQRHLLSLVPLGTRELQTGWVLT
jgi:hypothetical protein